MRLMILAVLLSVGYNSSGCGEAKKDEPTSAADTGAQAKKVLPENVLATPPESPRLDEDVPSELGAILNGNSQNVLADPGGQSHSGFDKLTAKSEFKIGPVRGAAEPYYRRGKAHLEAGELNDALAELESAVKLTPKHGRIHFAMGQAQSGLSDANAARASLEEAIKIAEEWDSGDSLDKSIQGAKGEDAWVAEAYRQLGYAIRASGGSNNDMRTAWEKYIDRATVEDDSTREIKMLLIPLRARH